MSVRAQRPEAKFRQRILRVLMQRKRLQAKAENRLAGNRAKSILVTDQGPQQGCWAEDKSGLHQICDQTG